MTSERAAVDRAPREMRVFVSNRESRCDDCRGDLGRYAMIFLAGERGALCLTCADLDHLTFLCPGDAALTRRARKYSTLAASAVLLARMRGDSVRTLGRVGRSAAAKRLDEEAVQLAVVAHVRHDETHYDELLVRGVERREARDRVREDVDRVLSR